MNLRKQLSSLSFPLDIVTGISSVRVACGSLTRRREKDSGKEWKISFFTILFSFLFYLFFLLRVNAMSMRIKRERHNLWLANNNGLTFDEPNPSLMWAHLKLTHCWLEQDWNFLSSSWTWCGSPLP